MVQTTQSLANLFANTKVRREERMLRGGGTTKKEQQKVRECAKNMVQQIVGFELDIIRIHSLSLGDCMENMPFSIQLAPRKGYSKSM